MTYIKKNHPVYFETITRQNILNETLIIYYSSVFPISMKNVLNYSEMFVEKLA